MSKITSNTNLSPLEKSTMKIKICGMKYPENILEVSQLLPDYMGFIFWKKSVRYFDGQLPNLPKSIKKVGVFVNQKQDEIIHKIITYDLQAVQLHGQESAAFCEELKNALTVPIEIIKVFSVTDTFNFNVLKPFESVCDYFLFDTKGRLPGGNGTTFDWKLLENYPSSKPFFLSGGIGMNEISRIIEIRKTNLPLYAIDINSKFEIEAGLKNIKIIQDLLSLLKN